MVSIRNGTRLRVDTWHDLGHTSNLSLSLDKRGIREKNSPFPTVHTRERGDEGKRRDKFPPTIYEVPRVSFHQAKNKSSSHRREVHVGTLKEGFHQRSKRRDFGKSKLSGLGGFLPVYHAPISKGFFLPWLTFTFLGQEKTVFRLRACLAKKNWIFGFCKVFVRLGKPLFT